MAPSLRSVFKFVLWWTALLDFYPCLADYKIWITLSINCCIWISVPCVCSWYRHHWTGLEGDLLSEEYCLGLEHSQTQGFFTSCLTSLITSKFNDVFHFTLNKKYKDLQAALSTKMLN